LSKPKLLIYNSLMNFRQKKFAEFFAESGRGAEAARKAGYSSKGAKQAAHRLLLREDISRHVLSYSWQEGLDARAAKLNATRMLHETFAMATNATAKRLAVDALCRLHGLVA
jgi:phage terminase small subunit